MSGIISAHKLEETKKERKKERKKEKISTPCWRSNNRPKHNQTEKEDEENGYIDREREREKGKGSHDVLGRPENAISMELLAWIEPKPIPLFPSTACAPISVHVRLKPPWLPFYVPQELKVQFIVRLLEHVSIRCLQQQEQ